MATTDRVVEQVGNYLDARSYDDRMAVMRTAQATLNGYDFDRFLAMLGVQ